MANLLRCPARLGALVWLGAIPCFPQTASPELQLVPSDVIEQRLRRFSRNNWTREAELAKMFQEAGCSVDRVAEQSVTAADPPNVSCLLPGTTGSTILVGGHSDFRGGGDGVVDDWSGSALLPSLFQTLQGSTHKHRYIFIAFAGEEHHMMGSRFYRDHLSREESARIRAMVNLDCIGAGPTEVWASHADAKLLSALARVAHDLDSPVSMVNLSLTYDDATPFRKHHIATISIHSLTGESIRVLHNRRDTLAAMNLSYYYSSYRLIAAYLAYLDSALE